MKKGGNRIALTALLLAAVLAPLAMSQVGCREAASRSEDGRLSVDLERVVDGDTIIVLMPDGSRERVRYIGIDAPEVARNGESAERLSREATAHNRSLVQGGRLVLDLDVQERDQYGRLLAYVWAGETFVNLSLVSHGLAYVSTWPPNVRHVEELLAAQRAARAADKGLWSKERSDPPPTPTSQPRLRIGP